MTPSPSTIAPEEQEQILQTIEMFEVIVQANPQDCQSMEILKDAYLRLGMKNEAKAMLHQLATTNLALEHFSAAILNYEDLLKHEPDDPQILAAMSEVEERMATAVKSAPAAPSPRPIDLDFQSAVADTGTLMATSSTARAEGFRMPSMGPEEVAASLREDGNEALAKFLVQNRLAPEAIVQSMLSRVHKKNNGLAPEQLGASLIDEIVRRGGADLETLLCGILDRTKFAYVPLEHYEIDRQIVKMLPESITLNRLIVPFDIMSRTLMIATANPFDALGKQAVQQLLDYTIQWHLASPQAIYKVLGEAYRLTNTRPGASMPNAHGASASPAPPLESVAPAARPDGPASSSIDAAAFRLAK